MSSDVTLIQEFVNTLNVETGADVISDWLAGHGAHDERGVARAVEVREALREVLLANNGETPAPEALATLDGAARRAPLRVAFDEAATARLEPAAEGVDGAIGRVLAAVARVQAEGDWPRLKACGAADCQYAYFDESRNRSRHWCSMEVCGNRAKARSYRARTAG